MKIRSFNQHSQTSCTSTAPENSRKNTLLMLFSLCLVLLLSLLNRPAYALSTDWLVNPQQPEARVRLHFSGEADPTTRQLYASLEVQLSGDWKTYWRSPGEAGIPPEIDWRTEEPQGSSNIENVEWLWPVPERIEMLGLHTLGYKNGTVFPLLIQVKDLSQPVAINARLRLSSCTTVCVLTDYEIQLEFTPTDLKADPQASFLIDKALSRVPTNMPDTGLSAESVVWDKENNKVVVTAQSETGWEKAVDVIIDGQEEITFSLPEVTIVGNQLQAIMNASSWLGEYNLSGESVTVTLLNGDSGLEKTLPVEEGTAISLSGGSGAASLIVLLGLALLGGLILNLMPCVLPVLGMKLSSVLHASGQEASLTRKQFLSSAAGIIFSFWLLATFLWILKLTGNSIGWGIQFQNPWFIGFMVVVTALFAANLMGMFEIRLPSFLSTKLATAGDNSTAGHFVQGMFATLLATPCSAPFLGTAVAFALSTNSFNLFAIFTALGIGLALPYLLIAARPSLLKWMPKPGQWMINLRRILALMLLVTSLWLISLLQVFLPVYLLLIIAVIPTLMILHALLTSLMPQSGKGLLLLPSLFLSMAIVLFGAWSTGFFTPEQSTSDNLTWKTLNEQEIASSVAKGKVIFVDVTADWCITCKANKIRVIDRDPTNSLLQQDFVVTMRGDWTRPSEEINAYLQKNGRFGVPFNIIYGPGAPEGIPLPVILDHDTVTAAIEKATSM
ncbi:MULTISPECIES: protein-disulfide reductase DsbD [unclassified Endozoicomonas]|uniref:protein-disulfide reductase DsbD family protein n=1 Tax=unclassified Endozoicomonas TaxID=2644528 RepID=UPI0021486540|nr:MULTISPECIES: protein-disulfide reductase DsbD domain-containing protein [unclassified Endozoicomonas]